MEAGEGWDVTFNFVVEGLLLLLVATLGLVGNFASFVILMRKKVQQIFHNLLLLLSTFDTVSIKYFLHRLSWIDRSLISKISKLVEKSSFFSFGLKSKSHIFYNI